LGVNCFKEVIGVRVDPRLLALCLAAGIMSACSRTETTEAKAPDSWDPKAAASYLDQREVTWMEWPGAARDHGTFCVSCHTAVPYALSRPVLRKTLSEDGPSANERKLLDNVTKRVKLWNDVAPFYSGAEYDGTKPSESRGTEAVLNALILANYDVQNGHLSDTTRAAFRNMWELQQKDGPGKGAWSWLQFNMEPFEAKDSQYYGAALAAVAVGTVPDNYRATREVQENVGLLREYLNREYATQSMMNRVVLLWASTKLPGLVEPELQRSIIKQLLDDQQADGGWKLSSLAWPNDWSLHSFVRERWRSDWTRQDAGSDGYATALIAYVLQQAGVPTEDPQLRRGFSWLARNQDKARGFWPSFSLTKHRSPDSNVGHFMDDAATGYAVLALSQANMPR
jgi:squalene-hopene/tetraprenyl-beta-curcumene cyclase